MKTIKKARLQDPAVDVIIKTEKIGKRLYYIAQAIQIDIVAQGLSLDEALRNLKLIIKDRIKEQPAIQFSLIKEEEKCPLITRIFL